MRLTPAHTGFRARRQDVDSDRSRSPDRAFPCRCLLWLAGFWVCLSVWLPGGLPSAISADLAAPTLRIDAQDPTAPWRISADRLHYDQKQGHYVAEGNVQAVKKNTRLMADFIRVDHKNSQALAIGNVVLTDGTDVLTGSRILLDLRDDTGTVYDGALSFRDSHFYIKGDRIEKVGKKSYTAHKASVSTCSGDDPVWKITGNNIQVTLEGYGYASHAAFWTRAGPVFYFPYVAFPVKLKRQSGLLSPLAGQSERKGYEFQQPYFWAINDASDATFYGHYMSDRGVRLGTEYRYFLSDSTKGTLMFDFLDDRQVDDGKGDSSDKWGFTDDKFLRPNSDRYWFRMKHNHLLPYAIYAKIDLDVVSDQDYLHEFYRGYNGYEESDRYFERQFGRGLDDRDNTIRKNSLIFSRTWEQASFNIEGRWYDNVVFRRQSDPDDPDTTLHRLPTANFDMSKQAIFTSPVYFDMASEFVRFYRKDGLRGYRFDLYPRIYLPVAVKNYFTFEPSLGVRETYWHTDQFNKKDKNRDSSQLRDLSDFEFTLSTEIDRIFSFQGKNIDKIRHSVVPKVAYEYRPEKAQSQFPRYDDVDRIGKQNSLSYSLINTFISRYPVKPGGQDETTYNYEEFCRFELGQSYDINEANDKDKDKKEPFSDIAGRIDLNPSPYFSLDFDTRYSVYKNDFTNFNTQVALADSRGDTLQIEHRYRPDSSDDKADGKESIYAKILINATTRIGLSGEYERDIYNRKDIKTGVGVLYKSQCWSVGLRYHEEANDRYFLIDVNLYGLGGFGSSFGEAGNEG